MMVSPQAATRVTAGSVLSVVLAASAAAEGTRAAAASAAAVREFRRMDMRPCCRLCTRIWRHQGGRFSHPRGLGQPPFGVNAKSFSPAVVSGANER